MAEPERTSERASELRRRKEGQKKNVVGKELHAGWRRVGRHRSPRTRLHSQAEESLMAIFVPVNELHCTDPCRCLHPAFISCLSSIVVTVPCVCEPGWGIALVYHTMARAPTPTPTRLQTLKSQGVRKEGRKTAVAAWRIQEGEMANS